MPRKEPLVLGSYDVRLGTEQFIIRETESNGAGLGLGQFDVAHLIQFDQSIRADGIDGISLNTGGLLMVLLHKFEPIFANSLDGLHVNDVLAFFDLRYSNEFEAGDDRRNFLISTESFINEFAGDEVGLLALDITLDVLDLFLLRSMNLVSVFVVELLLLKFQGGHGFLVHHLLILRVLVGISHILGLGIFELMVVMLLGVKASKMVCLLVVILLVVFLNVKVMLSARASDVSEAEGFIFGELKAVRANRRMDGNAFSTQVSRGISKGSTWADKFALLNGLLAVFSFLSIHDNIFVIGAFICEVANFSLVASVKLLVHVVAFRAFAFGGKLEAFGSMFNAWASELKRLESDKFTEGISDILDKVVILGTFHHERLGNRFALVRRLILFQDMFEGLGHREVLRVEFVLVAAGSFGSDLDFMTFEIVMVVSISKSSK